MSTPTAQSHADSSSSASKDDDVAIREAQLCMLQVVHTLKFARAIKATQAGADKRMQAVADLLKEDANRPDPLIDISMTIEGDRSCVLFQLLHFFQLCIPAVDDDWMGGMKNTAMSIITNHILPLQQKLLRSFDPAIVDAATGNSALHVLAPLATAKTPWVCPLIKLLIDHGVSVHARNKEGCTPLLQIASVLDPTSASAGGMLPLFSHGADLNAQDNDGNSLVHLLVKRKALVVLQHLLSSDQVDRVAWFLANSAGQTATDLAADQLAQRDAAPDRDQSDEFWMHRLLLASQKTWTACSRPIVQRALESVLVPDLAALVLAYVDGSGQPFPAAQDPKDSAKISKPAAAAAASTQ